VTRDYLTLTEALGFGKGTVVALVGGGGKTTTLRRLCEESSREGRRVLATTTARMKMEELREMGEILLWDELDATGQTWRSHRSMRSGGTDWIDDVLSGRPREQAIPATFLGRGIMRDKIVGLPVEYLGELLSRLSWDLVIVEADGSRGRSIKGHRLGEPAIPLCATHCVIVLGADGLDSPVTDDHFHRPEVVQDLLGMDWGEMSTPGRVADLLSHPRGLLSKIPGDIQVLIYVNKAPLGSSHGAANLFARTILTRCSSRIRRVAIGDNRQGGIVEVFTADEADPI
jgi:probable selenium-dependent hydroxylase accessory protein YqeC